MASEGASSSTQRVPLPSTIRCVQGGDEKDGIAPMCKCGVYAIMYKSRTSANPNRLFLGFPFFKLKNPAHCKFFIWLDDHVAKIGGTEKSICENEVDDVEEYLCKNKVEHRLVRLEKKLAYLEKKKKMNVLVVLICLFVTSVAVVVMKSWKIDN